MTCEPIQNARIQRQIVCLNSFGRDRDTLCHAGLCELGVSFIAAYGSFVLAKFFNLTKFGKPERWERNPSRGSSTHPPWPSKLFFLLSRWCTTLYNAPIQFHRWAPFHNGIVGRHNIAMTSVLNHSLTSWEDT